MGFIDSKAAAATLGAAVSSLLWFLLAKFDVGGIGDWSAEELATATGFTVTIVTFVFAYLVRNDASAPPDSAIDGGAPPDETGNEHA